MLKIGDLRAVCKKCENIKKCPCYIGSDYITGCSTICRDEDIECGCLEQIGLLTWEYKE